MWDQNPQMWILVLPFTTHTISNLKTVAHFFHLWSRDHDTTASQVVVKIQEVDTGGKLNILSTYTKCSMEISCCFHQTGCEFELWGSLLSHKGCPSPSRSRTKSRKPGPIVNEGTGFGSLWRDSLCWIQEIRFKCAAKTPERTFTKASPFAQREQIRLRSFLKGKSEPTFNTSFSYAQLSYEHHVRPLWNISLEKM